MHHVLISLDGQLFANRDLPLLSGGSWLPSITYKDIASENAPLLLISVPKPKVKNSRRTNFLRICTQGLFLIASSFAQFSCGVSILTR